MGRKQRGTAGALDPADGTDVCPGGQAGGNEGHDPWRTLNFLLILMHAGTAGVAVMAENLLIVMEAGRSVWCPLRSGVL